MAPAPKHESTSEEEEAVAEKPKRANNLSISVRNVFNTPQWLCDAIESFTGGIDLDPCSNPLSKLKAKMKYGYGKDGAFINALSLEDWERGTNWVYLNPPGVANNDEEKSHGHNLHQPFWSKCFAEIKKGNVKRVIGLIPQRSFASWNVDISLEGPHVHPE